MCNCGKNKPKPPTPSGGGKMSSQSFAFIAPSGQRHEFGSKLEADAEKVRAGGGRVEP